MGENKIWLFVNKNIGVLCATNPSPKPDTLSSLLSSLQCHLHYCIVTVSSLPSWYCLCCQSQFCYRHHSVAFVIALSWCHCCSVAFVIASLQCCCCGFVITIVVLPLMLHCHSVIVAVLLSPLRCCCFAVTIVLLRCCLRHCGVTFIVAVLQLLL